MFSIIKLRLLRLRDDIWVFVLMTAMAFGLTAIFSTSLGGYKPKVMVVDEDRSSFSEAFVSQLKAHRTFNFIESDKETAVDEVEEGNVLTGLLIGEGFEDAIKGGDKVTLGIIKVKDDILIHTLHKLVSCTASKMAGGVRIADITGDFFVSGNHDEDRKKVVAAAYESVMDAWRYKVPIEVKTTSVKKGSDDSYDSLKHSMIGFTLFFSMYTMVFGIGTILSDRQYKTWQRMLISPVSRPSILGGSMVVAYLTGALQMGVLILAGRYLLGIDWGSSIGGVLMVAAAFVFAVTSMGLMLSGIVKTHGQLSSVTPVVLTSTSMLGGCMWPLEIVNNRLLLFLAELTPQKWAMQGMEGIAIKGMGFEAALMPTVVLLGMGIVFFAVGVKLIKFE